MTVILACLTCGEEIVAEVSHLTAGECTDLICGSPVVCLHTGRTYWSLRRTEIGAVIERAAPFFWATHAHHTLGGRRADDQT